MHSYIYYASIGHGFGSQHSYMLEASILIIAPVLSRREITVSLMNSGFLTNSSSGRNTVTGEVRRDGRAGHLTFYIGRLSAHRGTSIQTQMNKPHKYTSQ